MSQEKGEKTQDDDILKEGETRREECDGLNEFHNWSRGGEEGPS